jgi:quercetin dioxygenase-like cupin family protein
MNVRSVLLRLGMVGSFMILANDIPLAQTSQVTRTELQRVAISDFAGHEGVLYKAVIVPGGKSPKHTHPGDEFIYVLKGTFIIEPEGKAPLTLHAGDSTYNPKGTPHFARNGSTTEPVETLVFLVVEAGKPLATTVE